MTRNNIQVHGKLMTADSLWARRTNKAKSQERPQDADEELLDDDVDVDAELERADIYAVNDDAEDEAYEKEDVVDEILAAEEDAADEYDEDDDEEYDEELEDRMDDAHEEYADDEEDDVVTDDGYVTDENEDQFEDSENLNDKETEEMAKTKMTLSDRIRQDIQRRVDAGEEVRGKDVVQNLAAKGFKVSPAQVSQIIKKMGVKSAGRTGPRKKATQEPARAANKVGATGRRSPETRKARSATPRAESGADRAAKRVAGRSNEATTQELAPGHLRAARAFLSEMGGDLEEARRYLNYADAVNIALDNA
jgi:hypothetical protein